MKISLFAWAETALEQPVQLTMIVIMDFRRSITVGEFGNQPGYSSNFKVPFINGSLEHGKVPL